jgi:hypothetical protein
VTGGVGYRATRLYIQLDATYSLSSQRQHLQRLVRKYLFIIRAVFTTIMLRILFFWDLMMSSGVNGDGRFGRNSAFISKGSAVLQECR